MDSGVATFVNTSWIGNYATGDTAYGGAFCSSVCSSSFVDCTFESSRVEAFPRDQSTKTCKMPFNGFDESLPASGGTLALAAPMTVELLNVTISDTKARDGGAVLIANAITPNLGDIHIVNTTISRSVAKGAGGGVFFDFICSFDDGSFKRIIDICSSFAFDNVNAAGYGDLCASPSLYFILVTNSASQRGGIWFTAPADKLPLSFALLDAFNNTVRMSSIRVDASLSEPAQVKMRSGAAQDAVFSSPDGSFTFDDFSLLGNTSALAEVQFGTAAMSICAVSRIPPIKMRFQISACLPSYTLVGGVCEPCPSHTYALSPNPAACIPCQEEATHQEISDSYSCLMSPDTKSEAEEHRSHSFEVAEGFYPSPHLEDPDELLECPNEACLPFQCNVRRMVLRIFPKAVVSLFFKPASRPFEMIFRGI
jgi:hypothetical protein